MTTDDPAFNSADPLCQMSARELAEAYRRQSVSPVEVVRACLARAEEIDPVFNAFSFIDHARALDAAKASENRWANGAPLSEVDGIPATIKDIVWVKDWQVRYGSSVTSDAPATEDAPSVQLMRNAGVIFVGQTTTPEFGWKAVTDSKAFGITRNPRNKDKTAGGSSGGAAVAAALGAGVFHLGTDGGGSIRIPSAFCGLTGLKPTFTRVPAYPASAFGTVAHIGPMCRNAADAFAMLKSMSGRDRRDWYQGEAVLAPLKLAPVSLKGLRIGYWSTPPAGTLDPEIAAIVDRQLKSLEAEGAIVEPFELPGRNLLDMFHVHWFSGAAARLSPFGAADRARIDPGLVEVADTGAAFDARRLVGAQVERADFGARMDQALADHDFILSPAVTIPAFEAGLEVPSGSGLERWTEWASFSFPINLTQQPAGVLPCGMTHAALPVALQVIGARGADAHVLSFIAKLEETLDM
ncbi:amidase [Roseibium album]|uniref:amidase n=1 Tax=Roseibium album TaxID=311410 RepID=UPI00248F50A1|nr:amidase [Roseibium album]